MVGNEICYQNIFLWGRGIVHKAVVCRQEFCILPCFSIPRSSLFERIVWLASFIAFLPSKLSHFIFFPSIFLFFTKPQNPVTFSSFNFSPPFSPSFSHFPLLPSILEIIVFQPIHLFQLRPLSPSVPLSPSSISQIFHLCRLVKVGNILKLAKADKGKAQWQKWICSTSFVTPFEALNLRWCSLSI